MELTFIGATVPLTKNLKTGESYPQVSQVTSYAFVGDGLEWLYAMLKTAAANGFALLTGGVDRPLHNESRAGHSVSLPTQLLILDVDNDNLPFPSRDALLTALGFNGSYIFQYSSGAIDEGSLRGHYFLLLDSEYAPAQLKQALKQLNFTHLKDCLTLTASQLALKWPLDVIVNDPGRVVYIAPPICDGDPIPERILLVQRGAEIHELPLADHDPDVAQLINELRGSKALPPKTITAGPIDIEPGEITVTDIKEERGFVYLNLNGGDSWGYYFDPDNPNIVCNFKDEPTIRLKDIAPDLFEKYYKPPPDSPTGLQLINGEIRQIRPMVFREPADDVYYQVLYDVSDNKLISYNTTNTRARLNDFMLSHGGDKPSIIYDGVVEFNPSSTTQLIPAQRYLNTFAPTPLMLQANIAEMPPRIETILRHLTVDEECYNHFLNWLAFVFQRREKTGTAWLFHGTSGTGKGTLFHSILRPIFGDYSGICTSDNIADNFNSHLKHNLLLFIDEFNMDDLASMQGKVWNKLKSWITEPVMTIRGMRKEQKQCPSFTNIILASNNAVPVRIDDSERRINIAPRQHKALPEIMKWHDEIPAELPAFCGFLANYKVNEAQARTILNNQARAQMIEDSRTSHEQFFFALRTGDIAFFMDYAATPLPGKLLEHDSFASIVNNWAAQAQKPGPHTLRREDVFTVYSYITSPAKSLSLLKFTSICKNNGVHFELLRGHRGSRMFALTVSFDSLEADAIQPLKRIK